MKLSATLVIPSPFEIIQGDFEQSPKGQIGLEKKKIKIIFIRDL